MSLTLTQPSLHSQGQTNTQTHTHTHIHSHKLHYKTKDCHINGEDEELFAGESGQNWRKKDRERDF